MGSPRSDQRYLLTMLLVIFEFSLCLFYPAFRACLNAGRWGAIGQREGRGSIDFVQLSYYYYYYLNCYGCLSVVWYMRIGGKVGDLARGILS